MQCGKVDRFLDRILRTGTVIAMIAGFVQLGFVISGGSWRNPFRQSVPVMVDLHSVMGWIHYTSLVVTLAGLALILLAEAVKLAVHFWKR